MGKTQIEWTDRTWNPVRGCSRVSEGCRNCYAERLASRFCDVGQYAHGFVERTEHGPRWTGRVELVEGKLLEPFTWTKPARVFVNSMSDLFHESLDSDSILRVLSVIAWNPRHTFQVLTKRPERARTLLAEVGKMVALGGWFYNAETDSRWEGRTTKGIAARRGEWPLSNLWLGVSVENQATADQRIPILLDTPAAVRFVSAEPLLEFVNLRWLRVRDGNLNALTGNRSDDFASCGVPSSAGPALDWVIIGGESGPRARRCDMNWVRSMVALCEAARTPVFVKQLGAHPWGRLDSTEMDEWPLLDLKGGDMEEWPADLRVREFPQPKVTT